MLMGLEFVAVDDVPALAPIKTTAAALIRASAAGGGGAGGNETADENCVTTPKSEECRLRPALACPPAPRKPRPAKRKAGPPPQGFYLGVPRDLSSVFVPVSIRRRPQCKRIRVDC